MEPYNFYLSEREKSNSISPIATFSGVLDGGISPINFGTPQKLFESLPSTPLHFSNQTVTTIALESLAQQGPIGNFLNPNPFFSFSTSPIINLTQEKKMAVNIYEWIKNPLYVASSSSQECQLYLQSLMGSLSPSDMWHKFQILIHRGWLQELIDDFDRVLLQNLSNDQEEISPSILSQELYKKLQSAIYFIDFLKAFPDYLYQAFNEHQA